MPSQCDALSGRCRGRWALNGVDGRAEYEPGVATIGARNACASVAVAVSRVAGMTASNATSRSSSPASTCGWPRGTRDTHAHAHTHTRRERERERERERGHTRHTHAHAPQVRGATLSKGSVGSPSPSRRTSILGQAERRRSRALFSRSSGLSNLAERKRMAAVATESLHGCWSPPWKHCSNGGSTTEREHQQRQCMNTGRAHQRRQCRLPAASVHATTSVSACYQQPRCLLTGKLLSSIVSQSRTSIAVGAPTRCVMRCSWSCSSAPESSACSGHRRAQAVSRHWALNGV
jgi:hypothetical protein